MKLLLVALLLLSSHAWASNCTIPSAHVDSFSANSNGPTLTLTLLGSAGCGSSGDSPNSFWSWGPTSLTGATANFESNGQSLFVFQQSAGTRTMTIAPQFQGSGTETVWGFLQFSFTETHEYLNNGVWLTEVRPRNESDFFSATTLVVASHMPETATYAMLLMGLGIVGVTRRRSIRAV